MDEKQKILKYILTHLGDNFCGSGIDSYGRAYAFTDSEIAANSLEETLYNMGYEASKSSKENLESDYVIQEGIQNGGWYKRFVQRCPKNIHQMEVKNMRTDKKYMMIVTEEDDRYDAEDGYDCDFYADHPWEGNLIDIVYGNNIDELRGNGENEGMFYMLYLAENGERIGYGCVDFDTIEETISRYELEKCKDMNTTWTKDDIINVLVEDGIEPTNVNITKVITADFVQNFKDRIIELGNEMISWQVSDVFKEKGE